MKRSRPLPPFLIADLNCVQPAAWRLSDVGEPLSNRLEHWDPDLTLRLDRAVVIDMDRLRESSGIADDAGLAITTVWRSDRTRLRDAGAPVQLEPYDGMVSVSMSLDVPGRSAGGALELHTVVFKTLEDGDASPLVARRAGSALWRDRVVVALEGGAARFPVTVVDFGTLRGVDPDAAWALEWSPHDLDQPVLGAMRLLVNARREAVLVAVAGEESPTRAAVASMISFDVARSLVHGALGNDEFIAGPREFEPDTVGRMLVDLLDRYWPAVEPSTLRRRARETPHRLDAELQARSRLLAP